MLNIYPKHEVHIMHLLVLLLVCSPLHFQQNDAYSCMSFAVHSTFGKKGCSPRGMWYPRLKTLELEAKPICFMRGALLKKVNWQSGVGGLGNQTKRQNLIN